MFNNYLCHPFEIICCVDLQFKIYALPLKGEKNKKGERSVELMGNRQENFLSLNK
jgi:hypothetical protein